MGGTAQGDCASRLRHALDGGKLADSRRRGGVPKDRRAPYDASRARAYWSRKAAIAKPLGVRDRYRRAMLQNSAKE